MTTQMTAQQIALHVGTANYEANVAYNALYAVEIAAYDVACHAAIDAYSAAVLTAGQLRAQIAAGTQTFAGYAADMAVARAARDNALETARLAWVARPAR